MEGEAEKIPRRGGKGLSKAETCLVYPGEPLPSPECLEGSSDKYRGPYYYPVSMKPAVKWVSGGFRATLEMLSPPASFPLRGDLTPSLVSVPAPLLRSRPRVQLPARPLGTKHAQLYIVPRTPALIQGSACRQELAPPPTCCLSWMPPFKLFLQPPHLQSNQPFASLWGSFPPPPLSPGKDSTPPPPMGCNSHTAL